MSKITLYELCDRACASILASPLNYNQGRFTSSAKSYNEAACGTAFCRAGWMSAHIHGPRTTEEWLSKYAEVAEEAEALLYQAGISGGAINNLFWGTSVSSSLGPGTAEYAKAGEQGLRDFMRRYEDKLKSNYVEVYDADPDCS